MKRGRLRVKYKIEGAEAFYIAERLHSLKVPVYDLIECKNGVILSIDFADRKKLFAISRNMCYNITEIKYCGKLSPLVTALSHLGVVACFLAFLAVAIALDGLVTKIEYKGDGVRYSVTVDGILMQEGIAKNRFLPYDLKSVEDKILREIDGISFVSLKKSGRILTVELYLAEEKIEPIDVRKKSIKSTVNGEILRLNVLSGAPLFSVGDRVKTGDEVIVGCYEKDGERIESYALGEVLVRAEYVYSYQSFAKGEKYKDRAMLLARQSLGEADELEIKVKEKQSGDKIIYEVTVIYLVTLS